ncbi:helix-turn-helix transcriptional regulator [Nocardia sp. CDC159]|uniref:Helix-turn-helix transcriptional regulator n=1 Tax=Nocardia pulmonis TaxID=2951408 RepID=A0A9X2IWZ0_9NOCA|nr:MULTISPECIES: helix-turn-helix transcriptional regulator [Nocardia]MCM6773290.1 helix-turn-helix transcriptional regulator [Nocardia pulmonis]MCM6786177.1 helix-turn-helix transcriptional regulator [Nocardia sp. CDC159]
MNDWQAFGGELRRLRLQQNRSLRGLAKSIRYDAGALSRIENGLRRPPLKIAQDLDAELNAGGSLVALAGECGAFAADGISAAAARSLAFADWATDGAADQLSVDSLYYELTRIATSYVHAPPQPLFVDLQLLRDQVWQLLRRSPPPARARELMFLGGVAIVLLAQVTDNLGNSVAAMQHALAAERLAERSQHTALLAWAAGAKALIAEWSGNPARAIEFARQGAFVAPPGEQRVRLAALEARCAARLGRAEEARAAVGRAMAAAEPSCDTDDITEFGGVLRFSMTKAAYYAGSAFRLIGDFDEAERWADQAITTYQSGPSHERSYGDEALARVDVAIARIARGSLDGASEVLNPVLALPPGQRIHPVVEGLRQVDAHLRGQSGTGRRLRDEISSFRTPETWTMH